MELHQLELGWKMEAKEEGIKEGIREGKQELLQSQIDRGTISMEEAIEYGYVPQEDTAATS